MAPSFLRFGSYEIHAFHNDKKTLMTLLDWTISQFYPQYYLPKESSLKAHSQQSVSVQTTPLSRFNRAEGYALWFSEVCERTARLIVDWERVGFVHGVMNTDNLSILGLTIDYGPYGWTETFDSNWTPNTTDLPGRRYSFVNQSNAAFWNLQQLARTLSLVVEDTKLLQAGLEHFIKTYHVATETMLTGKLGLSEWLGEEDRQMVSDLLRIMNIQEVDPTHFYRQLCYWEPSSLESLEHRGGCDIFTKAFYEAIHSQTEKELIGWLKVYRKRLQKDSQAQDPHFFDNRREKMLKMNPKFVPRNHLLYSVIQDVHRGDTTSFHEFYQVLQSPYEEQPGLEKWTALCPSHLREQPGCSMLSCSS
jgi:uncharacterized protein YdiU (UPF0061 family)